MQAEKLFEDISAYIEESRAILEKGELLELAGLDARVQKLCDSVLQLTQDERLIYAGRLQALFNSLTQLGDDLVARRDAVAGQVRDVPQHKKANVAYRIVEASDKNKKEGE